MSIDPKNTTNPDWLHQYLAEFSTTEQPCLPPTGLFSNTGEINDSASQAPPLATLLFVDGLAGYPVASIQIDTIPESQALRMTGVLDTVPLKNTALLEPSSTECAERWYLKVDSGAVDGQMRIQAILYTGALIMPLKETYHLRLIRASDGALLINMTNTAWILGALSIPFKIDNHYWLRYPAVSSDGNGYRVLSEDIFQPPDTAHNAESHSEDRPVVNPTAVSTQTVNATGGTP
jgi:hypothetical protein